MALAAGLHVRERAGSVRLAPPPHSTMVARTVRLVAWVLVLVLAAHPACRATVPDFSRHPLAYAQFFNHDVPYTPYMIVEIQYT